MFSILRFFLNRELSSWVSVRLPKTGSCLYICAGEIFTLWASHKMEVLKGILAPELVLFCLLRSRKVEFSSELCHLLAEWSDPDFWGKEKRGRNAIYWTSHSKIPGSYHPFLYIISFNPHKLFMRLEEAKTNRELKTRYKRVHWN